MFVVLAEHFGRRTFCLQWCSTVIGAFESYSSQMQTVYSQHECQERLSIDLFETATIPSDDIQDANSKTYSFLSSEFSRHHYLWHCIIWQDNSAWHSMTHSSSTGDGCSPLFHPIAIINVKDLGFSGSINLKHPTYMHVYILLYISWSYIQGRTATRCWSWNKWSGQWLHFFGPHKHIHFLGWTGLD